MSSEESPNRAQPNHAELSANSADAGAVSGAPSTDAGALSPQKAQLNANAKSFVPTKLDNAPAGAATGGTTPHAAPSTPSKVPTHLPAGGMPPPMMSGYAIPSPNARAFQGPFLGQAMLNPSMLRGAPPMGMGPPGVPMSPLFYPPPPPSPIVNVGNASLAALRSNVPPKFCCVLLVGVPGVGKTTIGRDLVSGLQEDKLGWQFFSGSNYVKETPVKQTPWETTKYVFDALGQKLDALLAKQATEPVKGLVIDKNCKGVEDLHYLLAMLKTRGLPLVGIVSLDVQDTDTIISRIGGGEEQHERVKHHRVIQARICEVAKTLHLLRTVDASKSKEEVSRALRTMVLGLSAQQPAAGSKHGGTSSAHHSAATTLQYSDSSCHIVDDYVEYANIMTALFAMVVKGAQTFPGVTEYTALSTKDMEHKAHLFKSNYVVRRKADGTKYLLVNDGNGLYLVPRHMRAVLRMPRDAWLGVPLTHVGKFVLDGDLVRLSKERGKEKFVVYDVLHWSEQNSTTNTVSRLTWTERQEKLNSHLCLESSAFYPNKTSEVIVVYQVFTPFEKAIELLEPVDYPCEGLVFHPKRQTDDMFLWRSPTSITVDLRLGTLLNTIAVPTTVTTTAASTDLAAPQTPLSGSAVNNLAEVPSGSFTRGHSFSAHSSPAEPPPTRVFAVEVYSTYDKSYVRLGSDTIEVRRPDVVEGSICICGLLVDSESKKLSWIFHRVRHDVSRAAYKPHVEKLLKECLITKQAMMNWLVPGSADAAAAAAAVAAQLPAPTSANVPTPGVTVGQVPQLGIAVQPDRPAQTTTERNVTMSRGVFGMSLGHEEKAAEAAAAATKKDPSSTVLQHFEKAKYVTAVTGSSQDSGTMVEQLKRVIPGQIKVQQTGPAASSGPLGGKKTLLESVVGNVTVVQQQAPATPPPANEASSAGPHQRERGERKEGGSKHRSCNECQKPKNPEDGRVDKKDHRFYCFACWAVAGTEFCSDCGEFAKGYRESTRRRVTQFYCNACWDIFNAKKAAEDATKVADGAEPAPKEPTDADGTNGEKTKKTRVRNPKPKKSQSPDGAEPESNSSDPTAAASAESHKDPTPAPAAAETAPIVAAATE